MPFEQRLPWSLGCLIWATLIWPLGQEVHAEDAQSRTEPSPSGAFTASRTDPSPLFRVGVAKREVTPAAPMPMWGYGARHARLSEGVRDPLWAKALVVQTGSAKLAIVGLDLGRGPTPAMMSQIRKSVASQGIGHVLVCGSHTHHGPVIELTDQPGFGKRTFDEAVAYAQSLPGKISEVILEADRNLKSARMGVAYADVNLNRNRQAKRAPKPTDSRLTVLRFDHEDRTPIAFLVHYSAHPVLTPTEVLAFSADYPGHLQKLVEAEFSVPCLFIQGAAGDLSPNPPDGRRDPRAFGESLAKHAIPLARGIATSNPAPPSLKIKVDQFTFATRINFKSPITFALYAQAFFPELVRNLAREWTDGIKPEMTTVLLNGELAIVGVPGEFFCQHAVRLRERAYLPTVLLFGYCNGHSLYYPTIEATSEGGYGADPSVSPVAIGAGESMMNQALINIYRLLGKLPTESPATGDQAVRDPSPSTTAGPDAPR